MVSSSSLTNYETTVTSKSLNGANGMNGLANGKIVHSTANTNGQPTSSSSSSATMPAASTTTTSKQVFTRNSFNGPKNGAHLGGKSIYFNTGSNSNFNNNNNRDQFNTSVSSNATDFYFRTLLRYVRSGGDENYAEKLEFLLKQCPIIPSYKSSMASNSNPTQTNASSGSGSSANNNTNISSSSGSNNNTAFSSSGSPLNTVRIFLQIIKIIE